ncbi:unnamed protein product, partial [Mesorhabditis belari]|uniref:F-box protein Hrt3/FBXO9 C-terminal domain-containing protein n=1 Tax=Mesorhabditis belari TaxID=2138241 RepID=A0AAF3EEK2_9BILA
MKPRIGGGEVIEVREEVEEIDELERFRNEWRNELASRNDESKAMGREKKEAIKREKAAVESFLEGCRLEQSHRPADIFRALHHFAKSLDKSPKVAEMIDPKFLKLPIMDSNGKDFEAQNEFLMILRDRLQKRNSAFEATNASPCYFNCLPGEILMRIVCEVVGKEISLDCLFTLSKVSMSFFLTTRSNSIWRMIFLKTTSPQIGKAAIELRPDSWYNLCNRTPRPLFNGVYVGRTTYVRHGETGYQDSSYRPYHTVCYYRYLRLFPDGTLMMKSSADPPDNIVHLMTKTSRSESMKGKWWLEGKFLQVELYRVNQIEVEQSKIARRRNRREIVNAMPHVVHKQTHRLTFRLFGAPKSKLLWVRFHVEVEMLDGTKTVSDMEINRYELHSKQKEFPPLIFQAINSNQQSQDEENKENEEQ